MTTANNTNYNIKEEIKQNEIRSTGIKGPEIRADTTGEAEDEMSMQEVLNNMRQRTLVMYYFDFLKST